jgi:hypothetical protein
MRSFCFLGIVKGLTYNLCSIISLLTPIRSEVLHVNMSLFLSRSEISCASSLGAKSLDIITVFSGTLKSSETILVSHSGSIVLPTKVPLLSFVAMLLQFSDFLSYK